MQAPGPWVASCGRGAYSDSGRWRSGALVCVIHEPVFREVGFPTLPGTTRVIRSAAGARNWATVPFGRTERPAPQHVFSAQELESHVGDLVVFDSSRGGNAGHVGIVVHGGVDSSGRRYLDVLGGNQPSQSGSAVSVARFYLAAAAQPTNLTNRHVVAFVHMDASQAPDGAASAGTASRQEKP